MTFETRQDRRKRILDWIILAAQVVAVLYLATHALIAWHAYAIDGLLAAVLTFLALGFGDLYWGMRWAYEGEEPWLASVALGAAGLCFTSWATRGAFNRWAMQFTVDMLDDFGSELRQIRTETEAIEDEKNPRDDADDRQSGGGARPLE